MVVRDKNGLFLMIDVHLDKDTILANALLENNATIKIVSPNSLSQSDFPDQYSFNFPGK